MLDSVISRNQRFIKVKYFELSGIKVILMDDFLNILGKFAQETSFSCLAFFS